jgi:hypothetical protein
LSNFIAIKRGFIFKFITLGQITPEQVEDLAQRKSMTVQEMTRWLQPLLG